MFLKKGIAFEYRMQKCVRICPDNVNEFYTYGKNSQWSSNNRLSNTP